MLMRWLDSKAAPANGIFNVPSIPQMPNLLIILFFGCLSALLSSPMVRKGRSTTFVYVIASILFLASLYHHLFFRGSTSLSALDFHQLPRPSPPSPVNYALHENLSLHTTPPLSISVVLPPAPDGNFSSDLIPAVSILLPAWEVLLIVSPNVFSPVNSSTDGFTCLFHNGARTPAKFDAILPFPDRMAFRCEFPVSARRRLPFRTPMMATNPKSPPPVAGSLMLRWNDLVYDSLTTDDDVVLFVKGMNKRQGGTRVPDEFRCIFGDDVINVVTTAVTSSAQEVFRCRRPDLTAVSPSGGIKVSLQNLVTNWVVPSVAFYAPPRKLESKGEKALICACTMVYNVAKFLKEWVMYHSSVGIDKFVLYDNGSDDDLGKVVKDLVQMGYDVTTYFWYWPKTQEAGFSHSAILARDSCNWIIYIDVDEFVYSPSWSQSLIPSKSMLQSFLPKDSPAPTPLFPSNSLGSNEESIPIGEILIGCHEFGPSNRSVHPVEGVMQGYNCRRKPENRHKSIVLLDAIDDSLLNVVHHFSLKQGYRMKKLNINVAMVNHYKYQAWPEFKAKFRRRVSAYVIDWTMAVNTQSNDRTPGLGISPVEPPGWPHMFCEVTDDGLKILSRTWFCANATPSGCQMAWQR